MDTQKVTAEYRLLHWMKVIQEQQNSGQSIKEFCESTGISRNHKKRQRHQSTGVDEQGKSFPD
jgi:hypothetical protein